MKVSIIKRIFSILPFFVISLSAGDYYSNSNKSLFVLPEYTALGGAALVFSHDATPLSNPANLPLDSFSQGFLSYSGFYDNTFSTSIASFITQFNKKIGFGLSGAYLHIPDIMITNKLEVNEAGEPIYDPSLISMKTSSEIFFNFSLGYRFLANRRLNISAGAALHCQRRRLIDWTGYGIGVDVGATLDFQRSGVRFSLLVDDLTTNYIHWSSEYHDNGLPHARIGVGWRREFPYIYGKISVMYKSPDLFSNEGVGYNLMSEKAGNQTEPQKHSIKEDPVLLITSGCYGFEYEIYEVIPLRMGFDESKRIFFGGGVNLFKQSLSFDFAYMVSYELPGTYSLSMGYRW